MQHHFATVRSEPRDDAADPLERRLLVEERNEHTDQPTALSLFSGRFSRSVVAELLGGGLHLVARRVADLRASAEDARHGADADTRMFGDLSHRGHVETLVAMFHWHVTGACLASAVSYHRVAHVRPALLVAAAVGELDGDEAVTLVEPARRRVALEGPQLQTARDGVARASAMN